MKNTSRILVFIALIVTYQSCKSNRDKSEKTSETIDTVANAISTFQISDKKPDSVKLRNLLIAIYRWHEKKGGMDYYFMYKGPTIIGLDTVKLDSALSEMKKTDFFSKEFLVNYEQIGKTIDYKAKHDSTLSNYGIVFPFQDYDTWHGGTGGQPNWDDLTIFNLSINNGHASFKWTTINWDSLTVRFEKENSKWKLSFLQYMDLKVYQSI